MLDASEETVVWRRGSEREPCRRYLQFPVLLSVPEVVQIEEDCPKPLGGMSIGVVLFKLEKVTGADYYGATEAIYRRVEEAP